MNNQMVKAFNPDGTVTYYESLGKCCLAHNIRYISVLEKLIEEGGLAPDGKTFFDYPTEEELMAKRSSDNVCVETSKRFLPDE